MRGTRHSHAPSDSAGCNLRPAEEGRGPGGSLSLWAALRSRRRARGVCMEAVDVCWPFREWWCGRRRAVWAKRTSFEEERKGRCHPCHHDGRMTNLSFSCRCRALWGSGTCVGKGACGGAVGRALDRFQRAWLPERRREGEERERRLTCLHLVLEGFVDSCGRCELFLSLFLSLSLWILPREGRFGAAYLRCVFSVASS